MFGNARLESWALHPRPGGGARVKRGLSNNGMYRIESEKNTSPRVCSCAGYVNLARVSFEGSALMTYVDGGIVLVYCTVQLNARPSFKGLQSRHVIWPDAFTARTKAAPRLVERWKGR